MLIGLAVVATIIGAGARADAAAFAVLGAVIAGVLGFRPSRRILLPAAAAVVVAIISAAFYLSTGQAGSVVSGLPNDAPPLTTAQLFENAVNVPTLWIGVFSGALGWLDTPMPTIVLAATFSVAAAAFFIGIRRLDVRRSIALALGLAAFWAVPFVLLAQSHAVIGQVVQPRYILPLLIIILGVASCHPDVERWWRGPRAWIAAGSLAIAASIALHFDIRRYTTGLDHLAADPGRDAEWWWNVPMSPAAVWIIGSVAFAGALTLIVLSVASGAMGSASAAEDAPEATRDPLPV